MGVQFVNYPSLTIVHHYWDQQYCWQLLIGVVPEVDRFHSHPEHLVQGSFGPSAIWFKGKGMDYYTIVVHAKGPHHAQGSSSGSRLIRSRGHQFRKPLVPRVIRRKSHQA